MWNTRIAVEPNWKEQAVEERIDKNIEVKIFLNERQALAFKENPHRRQDAFFINNDTELKENGRYPGEWRRFPLYNDNLNIPGISKIGTIGRLVSNKASISTLHKAKVDEKISDLREEKRKVNIIFVVDGTSSMGPYFEAVSNSIRRTMKNLINSMGNLKTLNHIRFGAVVYRDYAEGDRKTELFPLTSEYQDIAKDLSRVEAKDWYDTDKPEAVYYGIKKAISEFPGPEQTNVIILIGDAGNHHRNDETQVDTQKLIDFLTEYHCNFFAFQVHNDPTYPTYNEFVTQCKNLIESTTINLYNEMKPNDYKNVLGDPPKLYSAGPNKYEIPVDQSPVQASIVYSDPGSRISPSRLENEIPEMIMNIDNNTNDLLNLISQITDQGGGVKDVLSKNVSTIYSKRKASDFSPAIISFLTQTGLSEDELKIMMENKYQMFKPGFSALEVNGLKYPLFQRVVLLTILELSSIVNDIKDLAASGAGSRRIKMQNTWKDLLKTHIGNKSDEEMMSMGMDEINKMLFDVPTSSDFLKKMKLREITDPRIFPDIDFERYVDKLENKASSLNTILNQNNYPFSFSSNNIMYYWIPEAILP